jgi:hypothetical protein
MEARPEESETIETPEPVSEFKKGKAKREAKRKEVKVITEYVPAAPAPVIPDAESIASRAAEILFAKMVAEQNDVDKTPESKSKPRPKPPAKKKTESPPPTKYFGWC